MSEVWKDVKGYSGRYQVSNLGSVRSLQYRNQDEIRVLKPILAKHGYHYVNLGQRHKYVHLLVAKAFLGHNCSTYENEVDHINTIRTDNRVENLRIVTHKENSNNPLSLKNISLAQKGKKAWNKGKTMAQEILNYKHPKARKVLCIEIETTFNSAKDASKGLSCDNSAILKCCKGTQKSAGGYHWVYV